MRKRVKVEEKKNRKVKIIRLYFLFIQIKQMRYKVVHVKDLTKGDKKE